MNTQNFKDLLEKELAVLEGELQTIGRKTEHKDDWEAVESDVHEESVEDGDVAGEMEDYENKKAILSNLEIELKDVRSALEKIGKGTFGICEVCNKPIEQDRLEANPSARTCKEHMNG